MRNKAVLFILLMITFHSCTEKACEYDTSRQESTLEFTPENAVRFSRSSLSSPGSEVYGYSWEMILPSVTKDLPIRLTIELNLNNEELEVPIHPSAEIFLGTRLFHFSLGMTDSLNGQLKYEHNRTFSNPEYFDSCTDEVQFRLYGSFDSTNLSIPVDSFLTKVLGSGHATLEYSEGL